MANKTDDELREDIRVAEEAFDRSKTYYNAVGIQKARNQLKVRVDERRGNLRVIQGDAGSHDYSDIEIMGKALAEIQSTIGTLEVESQIPGVLMHCYNVAKHALMITKHVDEE